MSKFAYGEVRYIIKGKNKIVSSKKGRYRFGSRIGRQKRASVSIGALAMAVIFLLSACGVRDSGIITVVSRESGSGTRTAFTEIFGIEVRSKSGGMEDATFELSEVTNSTSVMITTVKLDKNAIGYISLGTMNYDIKAVSVDGVFPSAENIKNGSYKAVRSFAIVTMKDRLQSALERDFTEFVMSDEGQSIIEEEGYVGLAGNAESAEIKDSQAAGKSADSLAGTEGIEGNSGTSKPIRGRLTISGSSSVAPVMEALKEVYTKANPGAEIEVQQSDSTQGIMAVREGICDIGMTSRSLSESEIADGLIASEIARDGIVVIVNKENPVAGFTSDEIKKIYMGEISNWSSIESGGSSYE